MSDTLEATLADLGLTGSEARVFLALLKLGPVRAAKVVHQTGCQNSVVHLALAGLIRKGLVSYVRKGHSRSYQACHPRQLEKQIEARRATLASTRDALLALYSPAETQEASVYEGLGGFRSMLYELIDDAKAGDEFLFFAFYHQDAKVREEIYPVYKDFETERLRRRLILKGLVPEYARPFFGDRKQETLRYVRFPIPLNINIFGDRVSFTPGGEAKVSFLIRSAVMAQQFRSYHAEVWRVAGERQSKS